MQEQITIFQQPIKLPTSTTRWEIVTPEIARTWLTVNKNVRPLQRIAVNQYKEEILSGNFCENGEVVVFDSDGFLRNGQHRLKAIEESGVTIPLNVTRNVPPDQCDIFDMGGRRTVKQITGIKSTACATTIAGRIISGVTTSRIIPGKSAEYYKTHAEDFEWVANTTMKGSQNAIGRKSGCQLAAYFAFRNGVPRKTIEMFFKVLNSNSPEVGRECGPALKLFKVLASKYAGKSGSTVIKETLSITFQAIVDFDNKKKGHQYKPNDDWKKAYKLILNQDQIKDIEV